jgi:hypothetical protein
LASAIETPAALGFDGDAEVGRGVELRPGVWQPPGTITDDDVQGARLWLKAFEMEDRPAEPGAVEKWIMMLIAGMNHSMTAETLGMRVSALAFAVMDRPGFCFTVDTQRQALGRFGFVPTSKELVDFCAEVEAAERTTAKRLGKVCDIGARRPGQEPRGGRIDVEASMRRCREKQQRENRELAEKLGVKPMDVAPRMPHETDREFGKRIHEQGRLMVAEGLRAVRRKPGAAPTRAEMDEARAGMPTPESAPAEREPEPEEIP